MDEISHPSPRSIEQIRSEIDQLDSDLISLLEQRVVLAQEAGAAKNLENRPYFNPEREREIFERLRNRSSKIKPEQLVAIFREIISAARAAEKPLAIAYWGPEGTFSHQAAIQAFGRSVNLAPVFSIREVFRAVETGQADYGVVPIENSVGGIVPETLDMFARSTVKINLEIVTPIHHHLGTNAERLGDIKRVYAGPQPAAQCRDWLRDHLPNVPIIDATPTSQAVLRALEDTESAAIANAICLELYGLPAIAEHIQDSPDNRTRFVILGFNEPGPSGVDKTTVMFKLNNRQGELYRILGCFVENKVNLTMIESRPDPRNRAQYMFYIDLDGHQTELPVKRAINDLRSVALETVVLGSYPTQEADLTTI